MIDDLNPGLFTILGFDGTVPDTEFLRLVRKYPPAGFLLLEKNYESPEQLTALVSELKKAAGKTILIAVDQEPGRIQRFRRDFPISKRPSLYIEGKLEKEYRLWCAQTSSMLANIGVNLNLAPVLDLEADSGPNPALIDRVFGDDPDTVALYAYIFIEEHKRAGIFTCAKHFPGLGSARFDPHVKLSLSDEPLDRFENYHWQPFRKAVESGVDLIMTTHLKASSLDPENAATYSSKIIEYLRNRINFSGPIVSDDLTMGGAKDTVSTGDSAIKAIEAGHNLVIISRDIEHQAEVLDSIKNRYAQENLFVKIANQNEKIIRRIQDRIFLPNSRK